jgi:hypothetical protein
MALQKVKNSTFNVKRDKDTNDTNEYANDANYANMKKR